MPVLSQVALLYWGPVTQKCTSIRALIACEFHKISTQCYSASCTWMWVCEFSVFWGFGLDLSPNTLCITLCSRCGTDSNPGRCSLMKLKRGRGWGALVRPVDVLLQQLAQKELRIHGQALHWTIKETSGTVEHSVGYRSGRTTLAGPLAFEGPVLKRLKHLMRWTIRPWYPLVIRRICRWSRMGIYWSCTDTWGIITIMSPPLFPYSNAAVHCRITFPLLCWDYLWLWHNI